LAFHGTFDHTLDVKNRITVPSKFRAALAGTVFVVRGAEPCLSVYPEAEYQRLTSESLQGLAPLSPQYKKLRRLFNGRADDVELDGAGRIALKAKQLEHAGISGRDGGGRRSGRLPGDLGSRRLGTQRSRPDRRSP
jgi:MraZ protein